jgi:hypothetical protein
MPVSLDDPDHVQEAIARATPPQSILGGMEIDPSAWEARPSTRAPHAIVLDLTSFDVSSLIRM